ncbi:MAG: glycosyltransferase family 39 protein, partial [Oscillochloris sp.]|nr:glycosyltransferase family 39 protein [Oscillochloris sp.]
MTVWILLISILLIGAYFRTLSLTTWDDDTGQHPDERFFTDVASNVHLPASLGELYDSARSPLNPRSYEQYPLYVYGPFPIYLTRLVAVALTPNDGPDGPVLPLQVQSINGPPRVGANSAYPTEVHTNVGPLVDNPERAVPKITPLIALFNPDGINLTLYGQINKVGRGLAALFDLGSILLVFLIGRRLFDPRVGLLAAALSALAVMQIQQSHFFVDPIFSTFFALLALYWAVRVAQSGSALSYIALGLSIGAAMANRITLATLGLVAVAAAGLAALHFIRSTTDTVQHSAFRFQHFFLRFVNRELPLLVLAGSLTFLSFRTLAPDAFSGSLPSSPEMIGPRIFDIGLLQGKGFLDIRPDPRFISNLSTVRTLVSGESDYPPSQQWVDRPPYIFAWRNMVLWGMGPALGIVAWAGWLLFGVVDLKVQIANWRKGKREEAEERRRQEAENQASEIGIWQLDSSPARSTIAHSGQAAWVLFIWIAFYFAWQGKQFAITMRYLLPIYGALIIFAAWLLIWLWDRGQAADNRQQTLDGRWQHIGRWAQSSGRWAAIAVLLLTLGWAYAFSRIYTQPHSRVIAARWLASHATPGSQVIS